MTDTFDDTVDALRQRVAELEAELAQERRKHESTYRVMAKQRREHACMRDALRWIQGSSHPGFQPLVTDLRSAKAMAGRGLIGTAPRWGHSDLTWADGDDQ